MSLPETIRVKISSEAADCISLTPVLVREMPLRELVEEMLGLAGKDVARLQELLRRGTFVAGSSRFRWEGRETDAQELSLLLAGFPDPEPGRPFVRERCIRAVLKGAGARIEVSREAASGRRLFRRRSFWDVLMELPDACETRYLGYSYRYRADRYAAGLGPGEAALLKESAGAIKYSSLEAQVRRARLEEVELFAVRD